MKPVEVGDLIRYRLYEEDRGLVVVRVISLIETETGTKGVIEVPCPFVYNSHSTIHVFPGQQYKNANLSLKSNVYRSLWYHCELLRVLKTPYFPPRKLSDEPIDLQMGSLPPPKTLLKLSEAIKIATQGKITRPKKTRPVFTRQTSSTNTDVSSSSSSSSSSESECSSSSNDSDVEDKEEEKVIKQDKARIEIVVPRLAQKHFPREILESKLPKPHHHFSLNWDFPENAVGIDQAKRMRKLYMNENEWYETSRPGKCYELTTCALQKNKYFNRRSGGGAQKNTCERDEDEKREGVGLPFKFCTIDSCTRTFTYKSAIYNTAKFRLCAFCTQTKSAYNAKRYSTNCPLCLKATASRILCAKCTSKYSMSNNESGAFIIDYIIDLVKVIPNLNIAGSNQATCEYKNKKTRVDALFKGAYNNVQFTIIIEYDEQEHNNYPPDEEYEKMLVQLKFMTDAPKPSSKAYRVLFIRFNPVLDISHEGMMRLITLRQWIFWWIKHLSKVKDVLIFYMFYNPNNKRICFNDYDGMFLLKCPPPPSQQEGWDYAFVPEEQHFLQKKCHVQHYQDIDKAAERTNEKDKDMPNLKDIQRFIK